MALTEERLAALRRYCRIETDEESDDALLEELCRAAAGYLELAGIAEPAEGTARRAQYDLCVNALVLDAYDNRETTVRQMVDVADNPAFRRLLTQLKLTEPAGT